MKKSVKIENNLIVPKKSLGQNFLIDKNLCRKIVKLADLKNQNVIEIGPGTGLITDEILRVNPKKLIIIEKDEKLYDFLIKKNKNIINIKILNNDALKFNFDIFENVKIISNLPYNITNKIIIKLLTEYDNISEIILMIQKEVSKKINYKLKDHKKNKLSLLVEIFCNYEKLIDISNNVFYPKPKVQSSVIKLKLNKNSINKLNFLKFSSRIFLYKRKKLKNIIQIKDSNNLIEKILNQRAEDLSINELLYIFNRF